MGRVVRAARGHGPVLVLDDGSTDATSEEARAAGAAVVRLPVRRGKGAALASALATARSWGAARVVTLDADGQHDPADLPALLAAASAASSRAIVIGSRLAGAGEGLPRGRALAVRLAGFWLNWIAGTPVTDTQSGFRVYPVALFDEVPLRGGGFVFETEVLVQALRRGWPVREVPIRAIARAARPSRFRPLGDGVAIAGYLAAEAVARWGTEIAAAAREVTAVFSRERRTARHARMLAGMAAHAGSPAWSAAVGVAAAGEIGGGVRRWWRHARARRARAAAMATAAAPALLVLAGLAALGGGVGLDALDRVVRRVYDQRRLPPLEDAAPGRRAVRPPLVPR